MSLFRFLSIVLAVALPLLCRAQIVLVGLPHSEDQETGKKKSNPSARTKALGLPLWEDFSSTTTTFANPDVWFAGRSIFVNSGTAIRPPSIGVATFDGLDSTGRPYRLDDVLAKGYADNLESQPIDLSEIDPAARNSVFLSFMYQMRGRGETPDPGDKLLVSFHDGNAWVPVASIENDGTMTTDAFYTSVIQVSEEKYFHDGFKFRIQNFSRLSGPYDTWNVDYIYLNQGRTANDLDFPDRTVSEPLTSLFGEYRIMPVRHFQQDRTMTSPSALVTNLLKTIPRPTPVPEQSQQPVAFSTKTRITHRENKTIITHPVLQLDDSVGFDTLLRKNEYRIVRAQKLPDLTLDSLIFKADSIGIEFELEILTADNQVVSGNKGDYIPAKWSPIDFRHNDTTRASFLLLNKYAYDDGVAEYGASLNQPGAQVAYEYNLVGVKNEYVTFLEMYFLTFGAETPQTIELHIWSRLDSLPLYTELTQLQRSQQNVFWRKKLSKAVPVNKKFYIGWKQSTAATIATGLDKNTDSGDKMFYNTNGEWLPNTTIRGSLMLRPIFGEGPGQGPPVGLEEEKSLVVYPNPSSGTFRFGGSADRVVVYDMTGRMIGFQQETTRDETIITLPNASQGIYIIKAYVEGAVRTAKVMINQ